MGSFYCYNDKCPVRTDKEPWPRSDYKQKWVEVLSKNGKTYKRKMIVCDYCGEKMTYAVGLDELDSGYDWLL